MNTDIKKNNERARRMLPFVVEFVKFATGFVVIVAAGLLALRVVSAMMP